jgi:hypothetical protein
MRRVKLYIVVLAGRAGVHEAANLRALVSWPIGGLRACLAVGASQHGNGSRQVEIIVKARTQVFYLVACYCANRLLLASKGG